MYDGFVITRLGSAILGSLLLLIVCCNGLQYQHYETYANGEECALILDARGRTSIYDYTYNLLRGSFPPTGGSQTCITYDAVNHAYIEARKRINVARPKTEVWRPEDLATVGELLLDISANLAQTYGLTYEEIEKSLPLIDTSKTFIREVCPGFLSNVECRPGRYRRFDGLCTNLQNPNWGATLSPFVRLINPQFGDGLTVPRISITGRDLPLSRVVSRTMHPDEGYHDHAGTVMVIAWGQFMDHDYTLTGTPLDPLNRNDPEECCSRSPHLKNPYCNEILIPEDDYFYRLFNVNCMDFVRAFPAVRPGCRLGSRVPFNLLTGVLDGNTVYGITDGFARKLRTGYGGLLRMNPVFSEYGLKDLLPLKLDIPDEGCTRPNKSMYCFEAGEIRVNEQLVLTCMHTLLAREHNRLAKALAYVNRHWDDETLFQEARRIVIAEIQHITYNEFLPILLGKDVMEKTGLLLEKERYWDGYDPTINPGVIDAFAAAAFRFGHSLLPTAVERWSKAHKFIASKRLSDLIRRPYDLYRAGVFDEYLMGLMNQVAQAMDDSITQEVTNHLFKKVGAKFGLDLVSFNMQRGREFGIPSFMEFRRYCGLPTADTFDELLGSMPNETVRRYQSIFEHPADIDLWSGGVSERPLPGSMLGPTFACLIATQFSHSRRGDRFWYELPNQPSSFTLEQLNEIRKSKLSRLICDNTDLIDTIQIYPMVLPDHEINPRVPCRSGILPSIDLSKWAEFPMTAHDAQYDTTLKKSVADASTIRPRLQQFNSKQKISLIGKNVVENLKKEANKSLYYMYPNHTAELQTFAQRSQLKILQEEEKGTNKQALLPKLFFKNNQDKDIDLINEMNIVSTIIEMLPRKKRNNAYIRKEMQNIENPIEKRHTKRSVRILRDNLMTIKTPGQDVSKNDTIIMNHRHVKRYYEDQQNKTSPIKKCLTNPDLVSIARSTTAIPSTMFYKRIWEYINGTRSHPDIISNYDFLGNNSAKYHNLTCADKDQITVTSSRNIDHVAKNTDIKPKREFYKRIWDMINATRSVYAKGKARSKRNINLSESKIPVSPIDQLCIQAEKADYKKDKQLQTTDEKAVLDNSDPSLYTTPGFWSFVNKTQWLPKSVTATTNAVILNNNPTLSFTNSSEVADLNKLPDGFSNNNYTSLDNRTKYLNKSQDIIESRPSYLYQQETITVPSSSSIQYTIDDVPKKKDRTKPNNLAYDPVKVPDVDVSDYTDQHSLEKSNETITKYKEYDNSDYVDFYLEKPYDTDDSTSKSQSSKIAAGSIQDIQIKSNEQESALNTNVSHSNCTESKDFAQCGDKYDFGSIRSYGIVDDDTLLNGNMYNSTEFPLFEEYENLTASFIPIDFDINKSREPFYFDDFLKNDSFFKSVQTSPGEQNAKYKKDDEILDLNDRSEKSEEFDAYETYLEEQSSDYPTTTEGFFYRSTFDDQDEARMDTDDYTNGKPKNRKIINDDYSHYDHKDFLERIFEDDSDKESSDTEDKFLSRYFTKDVLSKLRETSSYEEAKKREKSRDKEDLRKILSSILDRKNQFSRLNKNLDKMIKEDETIPIKYNNFWSFEYESPRKKSKSKEDTEA